MRADTNTIEIKAQFDVPNYWLGVDNEFSELAQAPALPRR